MAREWAALTIPNRKGFGVALAVATVALVAWAEYTFPSIAGVLVTLLAVGGAGALMVRARILEFFGWWLSGLAYVGLPMLAMWWLRTLDTGQLVFWLFIIVWATDIGGYFVGKSVGGPKLAPQVSPKKTWSGLLGGIALSIGASLILVLVLNLPLTLTVLILASGLLAVWAQVGDLFESGIKRHFGVKDSGELIPGHGGLLDRVDGLVFVAPAIAILILVFPALFLLGH